MRRVLPIAAIAAGCLLLGGCALFGENREQFSRINFDAIYIGQAAGEVEQTLGTPSSRTENVLTYLHDHPYYKAVIKIDQGKVIGKTWTWEKEGEASTMPAPHKHKERTSRPSASSLPSP